MDEAVKPVLKNIRLIATGGTIASGAKNRVSTEGYNPSVITVQELLAELPELAEVANVTGEQIFLKPSSSITDEDMFALSKRVNEVLAQEDCDGVVITHGTDTMEETAFFLNLSVSSSKPVIVTGAMRPAQVISSDGMLNLFNAITACACEQSCGMGVIISMNDLLLSARDGAKFSTFKTEAFDAPLYGCLGTVRNGKVSYRYRPMMKHTLSSEFAGKDLTLPPVEIIYIYQGCGDGLFRAAAASGCKGIVIAGAGNGASHPDIDKPYRDKDYPHATLPFMVRSSRVPTGGVSGNMERFFGDIKRVLPSGDFTPHKARILLRFALSKTEDYSEILRIFSEY